MQIDALERTVRLSVRELAAFRNVPISDSPVAGPWRASVGQQWHLIAEEQTRSQSDEALFEVPLKARIRHKDWTFQIQGRVDQLLPSPGKLTVREVKTVTHPLPAPADELCERYPDYFAQAAVYLGLLRALPDYQDRQLDAELQFIGITDGCVQTIELTENEESLYRRQLNRLIPFLNDRRDARLRLDQIEIKPAFETLRDGQAELFAKLEGSALQAKTVLLEAPTGFGKTGIVLEHALRQMQAGIYERCIYLTSKSTGQLQTIEQLRSMIGTDLRFIQMRNRSEHRIESPAHTCTGDSNCDKGLAQFWFEADIHAPELFDNGTLTLKRAQTLGAKTGVCPYALTRGCLPFAEFWIGDANYIFAPGSQGVFHSPYGFDPAKTLLIIDEAHNLPDRAADALGVELSSGDLLFAVEELNLAGASRRLINIGNDMVRCVDELDTGALKAKAIYELLDLCEEFERQLMQDHFDYELAAPFAIEIAWRIPSLAKNLAEPPQTYLHWSPKPGLLRTTCLDASDWIAECLKPFSGSILMSATLTPLDSFRASCGLTPPRSVRPTSPPLNAGESSAKAPSPQRGGDPLAESVPSVDAIGHASWRDDAYTVAIDCRVDTRLKQRDRHYETTARTVAALCAESAGTPVAVFFASYQYAENVRAYLNTLEPNLRASLQPRGVDLAEQAEFIEQGLLFADVLFLILGSSYAEGVDQLGGKVHTAMVVGPALPEVNAVQDAKMEAHPSFSRDENFRDVYIVPAMRRIHQALGRLVRAPGHKARILLHGKRYAEAAYRSQLAPEYQTDTELHNDEDLLSWLQSK